MIRNLHEDARPVAAACLLLAALLVPGIPGFSDDRTLHMLLIGEVYPQECPLPLLFDSDPLYDYVAIRTREGPAGQLTEEMKQRYVKLYFPRTEAELRTFSMIFYVDADVSVFSGPQSQQMYDSIADGTAGSFFTFG